jgi:alpha-beta hydrolase superfamily lysophospholipase
MQRWGVVVPEKCGFKRRPVAIAFKDVSAFKETYGGAVGLIALTGQHIVPDRASDTVLVCMHPIGGTASLPVMKWLAEGGVHVLAVDSRYRGADYALIMEKVVVDLGAAVRYARQKLGYRHVVLLGWSGGGSLSAFFQAQAETPTITQTPAGDPIDLVGANLLPADGIALVAAHVSRHQLLTDSMDPAICDERDPYDRDAKLDIFGDVVKPPYDADFLERYRAAQVARNRRITAWVKEKLERQRSAGRELEEFAFVTHGTMADPRWRDPTIDPNDRDPAGTYMGDARIVNMSPIGFARYSSLRSWLSQWSLDDARGDGPASIARTSIPVLVVNNSADDACTPHHARRLFDAAPPGNREFIEIKGANHYYSGQPELASQAIAHIVRWMRDHGFHNG